jgi:hypothetical protein
MNYRFVIQASNPRALRQFDPNDASLSDAVQTVFPLETEYALMIWNWVYIPLSYKYDLSLMADDSVALVEEMTSEERGRRVIQWPSNTFAATWKVEWGDGKATVDAVWDSVLGDTEAQLKAKPTIVVPTVDFVSEWRRPLEVIAAALEGAGYTARALHGLARMKAAIDRTGGGGILYRE